MSGFQNTYWLPEGLRHFDIPYGFKLTSFVIGYCVRFKECFTLSDDTTPQPQVPSTADVPQQPRHLSVSGVRPLDAPAPKVTPAFSGFRPPSRRADEANPSHEQFSHPSQPVDAALEAPASHTSHRPSTPTTISIPTTPSTSTVSDNSANLSTLSSSNGSIASTTSTSPATPAASTSPTRSDSPWATPTAPALNGATPQPNTADETTPPSAEVPLNQPLSNPFAPLPPAEPAQPVKKRRWLRVFVIFTVLVGIFMFVTGLVGVGFWGYSQLHVRDGAIVPATPQPAPEIAQTPDGSPNWQGVSAAVASSVVTINVSTQDSGAVGSGVIYSAEGLILTNHHVIKDAQNDGGEIRVTLTDQRFFAAQIVGTDPTTDLAVIKLQNPPSDLNVASFGTSKTLAVGQAVMAIGSPLGLSNTVTTGIISALDRPVEVSAQRKADPNDPFAQFLPHASADDTIITNAIQIDASINPGNSGGPLFDAQGKVIGINSSIASIAQAGSDSAGSIGLGFAIPVDLARNVADQLVSKGRVAHAILGVTIKSVAVDVDGTAHLGAQVDQLVPGGAADLAGVHSKDLITHIDGRRVGSAKALQGMIRSFTAGDSITVTIVRDGHVMDIPVTLQERN